LTACWIDNGSEGCRDVVERRGVSYILAIRIIDTIDHHISCTLSTTTDINTDIGLVHTPQPELDVDIDGLEEWGERVEGLLILFHSYFMTFGRAQS
jgi:hypothetical protein